MKIRALLPAFFAVLLLPAVTPRHVDTPRSPSQAPKGLTAKDWSSIQSEYQRHQHAAVPEGDGYRARNSGQQWVTHFDGRGFTVRPNSGQWSWGLELERYGFTGQERTVTGRARATSEKDRVRYAWGPMEEWFVNDGRGLEHGFTLPRRPARAGYRGPLRMHLGVRGGLSPKVAQDGSGVSFADASGRAQVTYAGLKVWDAAGKVLPARFEPAGEGSGLSLAVEEVGAQYPLTIDPIAQQAYLKASNTGGGDLFGVSVAVSGETVVVGAMLEDGSATGVNGTSNEAATDSGAAYVFVRNAGVWSFQAYLKASNTGISDNFGVSVAISGDTVVVGAPYEDGSATGVNGSSNEGAIDSGAAYVFVRSGGAWTHQAYLKASNTQTLDLFGWSVGVSGDTVVVGAPKEDSSNTGVNGASNEGASGAGAAYVFVRAGLVWSQQAYLKAFNTGVDDDFGSAVAVSGDTVVVGASFENSSATGVNGASNEGATDSGAAYVFARAGTVWSQQAYLKASNTGVDDQFGWSVSVSGDSVVVGAPSEDGANETIAQSGAAYVFVRAGVAWSQQGPPLRASNAGPVDSFGWSVGIAGDAVVVGAFQEDSNATAPNGDGTNNTATDSGAAYLFLRGGGAWNQAEYLKPSNTGNLDVFGFSVAVSPSLVVVGAPSEDGSATGVNGGNNNSALHSGAAYAFNTSCLVLTSSSSVNIAPYSQPDPNVPPGSAVGGSVLITVAPGCSYTATTDVNWVTLGGASGTGNGTLFYVVGPNFSSIPRSAVISINGTPFTINQAADTRPPNERFVSLMYNNYLTRAPDAGGFNFWVQGLNNGSMTRDQIAAAFFNSVEYNRVERFVAGLYVGILGRDAEFVGWDFHRRNLRNNLVTQPFLVNAFITSPEYGLKYGNPDNATFVTLLFNNALQRQPAPSELALFVGQLQSGVSRDHVAQTILNAPEFQTGTQNRLNAFMMYFSNLSRDADAAGVAGWIQLLNQGMTVQQALAGFITSPEFLALLGP